MTASATKIRPTIKGSPAAIRAAGVLRNARQNAAKAAAAERKVVKREVLFDGGDMVVSVKPGGNARWHDVSFETDGGETVELRYKQWGNPVPGGFINYHLHLESATQHGNNRDGSHYWCTFQIMRKVYDNGDEFVYVDFAPVEVVWADDEDGKKKANVAVTHRVTIHGDGNLPANPITSVETVGDVNATICVQLPKVQKQKK